MGYAPENTLASIQKALELGAHCIEIDVYNVEGRLIVFHDNRLERTTNGTGYLMDHSFEYLRLLDAGHGERIPTLEEVCNLIKAQTGLNIELKGPGTADPVASFVENLYRNGWSKNSILVSSFNHRELHRVKELSSHILIGVLISCLPVDDAGIATDLRAFSVHPSVEFIDKRFVDDARGRGLRVYAYTVNHQEELKRMKELGVDGVFTDYPDMVIGETVAEARLRKWL